MARPFPTLEELALALAHRAAEGLYLQGYPDASVDLTVEYSHEAARERAVHHVRHGGLRAVAVAYVAEDTPSVCCACRAIGGHVLVS